jgi:hypothetical protein
MSNKKAPELHLVDGTTPRKGMPTTLPENIKKRIPKAEWLDNPDGWDKDKFIEETSEFLYTVYGIGNDQDKHTLAMLAEADADLIAQRKPWMRRDQMRVGQRREAMPPSPHQAADATQLRSHAHLYAGS